MDITEKEYKRIYHEAYITSHLKDDAARDRMFMRLMEEARMKRKREIMLDALKRCGKAVRK